MTRHTIRIETMRGAARIAATANAELKNSWIAKLAQSQHTCRDCCDWVRDRDHVIFTRHKVAKGD